MDAGHLLIPVANPQQHEAAHRVVWARYFPGGLAVHPSSTDGDRYTITHVRSGAVLRHRMSKRVAYAAARLLAATDWTFDASAVTREHATLIRKTLDSVHATLGRRIARAV